jgi:predicted DNA-binding protein YlxM (UPF0122 family)
LKSHYLADVMASDDFQDAALGRALKKRKELQDTINRAVKELERLEEWLRMYRDLSTDNADSDQGEQAPVRKLRSDAYGGAQGLFENLVLSVLREAGRPMKSPEIVQEFHKRGHPLGGNEIRSAWNRLWAARSKGILTNEQGLGYWIAGEPLSDDARQRALDAAKSRPKSGVAAVIKAARGTKKGRDPVWGPEEIATAERMLLAGKSSREVAAALGGVSQATFQKYFPGGVRGFQEKHPDVVIPKRSIVRGRPRSVTAEQEVKIAELRSEGKSLSEIAEYMGMKRGTIANAIARLKSLAEPPQ